MSERCDICQGREVINLPVVRWLESAGPTDLGVSYRSFPCPQCTQVVDDARVAIFQCESTVPATLAERPDIQGDIARTHGRKMGDEFVARGFATMRAVERQRDDLRGVVVRLRSRVGVVSASRVRSIEQRAVDAGGVIAQEAMDEALREMWNWGSYYGRVDIRKDDAERMLREGMKRVFAKHRERVG